MSYPWHDRSWAELAKYLEANAQVTDAALAPDTLYWVFESVYRYRHAEAVPGFEYDWVIVNLSTMQQLPRSMVAKLPFTMTPAFTNRDFVVWARTAPSVTRVDPDVVALMVERTATLPDRPVRPASNSHTDPVLPDRNIISRFGFLDHDGFVQAMDDFYLAGGYEYPTLRDRLYDVEMSRHFSEFAGEMHGRTGEMHGRTVVDIGCGGGWRLDGLPAEVCLTGFDISPVAVELCRQRFADRPSWQFVVGDAHALPLPDESADVVTFLDTIEHVWHADQVVRECARVLKPGGRLLLSAANRNSLHMVMTRKLGYPEWVTNYQHIAEFSPQEVQEMISAAGLTITQRRGLFFYPYWGVPGIDGVVRHLVDDDPDVVELGRELGELVGADHAYTGVYTAIK